MNRWIVAALTLLALVGLGVVVYGKVGQRLEKKASLDAQAAARQAEQDAAPKLTLARPVPGPQRETLRLTGTLKPEAEVALGFKVPGRVVEVLVKRGDVVRAGQILARIDTRDLQAQMQQADAGRRAAMAQRAIAADALQRARELQAAGAASDQQVVSAAGQTDALEANVAQVTAQRRYLELVQAEATLASPIDGVVLQAPTAPGFVVQVMSAPSFQIQRLSTLEFQGHLDDADAARVHAGLSLEVVSAAQVRVRGTLSQVIPSVDPLTRRVPIYGKIPNEDGRLFAGSMVNASVEVEAAPTLVIPASCLLTGDRPAVLVRGADGVLERRAIAVARVDGPQMLVRAGLSAEDRVVVAPGVTWREGATAPEGGAVVEASVVEASAAATATAR